MTLFIKRMLLGLLLLVVLLPVLQARFRIFAERQLGGSYTLAKWPLLAWESLLNNAYQPELERYLEERVGFRTLFIQGRNQLRFSLFHASSAEHVVVGRNGVVFEDAPVQAYLGVGAMGRARARTQVKRLRRVQQDLASRGIPLLVVLAPNKARHLHQLLPAHLPTPEPGQSDYEVYTSEMQQQGVDFLDFTPLFKTWGDTARYPLFPWGGTHWNAYGATLAADTLLPRLEQLLHAPVPRLRQVGRPTVTASATVMDDDLAAPMNLLWPRAGYPAVYPRLGPAPARPGEKRPNVLFVGDSFTWGLMFPMPFMQHAFDPATRFWYYNLTVYVPDSTERKDPNTPAVGQLNLQQEVESRQLVVVLMTDRNLHTGEFGFTSQLYNLYHPLTAADQARVAQLEKELASKQSWEEGSKPDFPQRMHEQALAAFEQER
ncbi:alginate O-acetyltransferase AlgX-related protein [Hymenobacter ruricola]|uniref:AlgX/AlgJ SGNH hydrolase-like domain-containing protein n=1 Tax=Hymenobacter ruricola TaxID=2791023 RepID=A0ABS0IB47_9BACT|nr:hypothetical protein [Hymenobacter ruricola]MBF9224208.1 hypothetical protein [Hymenobacter ruricola]